MTQHLSIAAVKVWSRIWKKMPTTSILNQPKEPRELSGHPVELWTLDEFNIFAKKKIETSEFVNNLLSSR